MKNALPLLSIVALVMLGCTQETETSPDLEAQIASLRGQVTVAEGRAEDAERLLEELRAELRARPIDPPPCDCGDEGDRPVDYEEMQGLRAQNARLKAELDQIGRTLQNLGAGRRETPMPQQAATRQGRSRVISLRGPDISNVDGSLTITGKLYNSGNADSAGSVEVTVFVNGRSVGTRNSYPMTIGAGMDAYYSVQMTVAATSESVVTAQANWRGD